MLRGPGAGSVPVVSLVAIVISTVALSAWLKGEPIIRVLVLAGVYVGALLQPRVRRPEPTAAGTKPRS